MCTARQFKVYLTIFLSTVLWEIMQIANTMYSNTDLSQIIV